jgi:hypothetical protein
MILRFCENTPAKFPKDSLMTIERDEQIMDLLWDVFPDESAIVGEDNLRSVIAGRRSALVPSHGSNAMIAEVFVQITMIVSLIDSGLALLDRYRAQGQQVPSASELEKMEALKLLALNAKLSELRQRELYQMLLEKIDKP